MAGCVAGLEPTQISPQYPDHGNIPIKALAIATVLTEADDLSRANLSPLRDHNVAFASR
jgi:hypothetical protein